MITWRTYLAKLHEDGVTLDQFQTEAITSEGERITGWMLARRIGDARRHHPLAERPDPDAEVPRGEQRRIANTLRLPPEKYIF